MAKAKQSASASQPLKASVEEKEMKITPISSRSLSEKLLRNVQKLQSEGVSNQAYSVNGTQVVWIGPMKKILFGADATEAAGETLNDAIVAAGL